MCLCGEAIDIIGERPITQCADYTQLLVPITLKKSGHASVVCDWHVPCYRPEVPKVRHWDLQWSFRGFRVLWERYFGFHQKMNSSNFIVISFL